MEENKKQDNFNVPQNYFEDFEERLFLKISEDKLPKNHGFKVPEEYFDGIENKVISKLNINENENKSKVISLFSKKTIIYAASIAACAILVFSLFNTTETFDIDELQVAVIEEYIEEGNITVDAYDLTSMISEEEEFVLEEDLFSEETLENYLIENIDNTSLLIE